MVSSIAPSLINVYANDNYFEEPEVSVRADTTAPDVSGFTVSLQPGYYDEGTVLTVRMKIVDDSPLALANLIIGPTPTGPCAGAIEPYDLVKIDDNGMYETNLTIIGCHRIRGYYIEDIYGYVTRFDYAVNEYCYYYNSYPHQWNDNIFRGIIKKKQILIPAKRNQIYIQIIKICSRIK